MYKIYNTDCLKLINKLPDNKIDLIVTDPPYGYSFMGKDWDKAVPSVETWKECLRILKPGAFAFIMSAPRQDVLSQMIVRITEAGFKTDFTSIYWTYATGFPKAGNIGKMVDKRLGVEQKVIGESSKTPSGYIRRGRTDEEVFNETNVTREPEKITEPGSKQAQELDGSYAGFQPKPAVEIIIVAMKPLSEKTYVDQAMTNGKGITWLNDCRIPGNKEWGSGHNNFAQQHTERNEEYKEKSLNRKDIANQGRFPANLIVSDDVLNDGTIRKSGANKKGQKVGLKNGIYEGGKKGLELNRNIPKSEGSFSRFFDLDAWAKENNIKQSTFPFLIVPKASKSEKNKGLDKLNKSCATNKGKEKRLTVGGSKETALPRANNHPTVKPIKLMSYLITLGSREGNIVLDPFMGSASTGVACIQRKRKFIGCELSPEYFEICKARLEYEQNESKN
jgi:site-specific DNA-methyltransferase (adenine-specific)